MMIMQLILEKNFQAISVADASFQTGFTNKRKRETKQGVQRRDPRMDWIEIK